MRSIYSAVSVGTEVMKMKNADLSYFQMAKKKPEQVKDVLNTLAQQGPMATYRKVMNKLDSLSPLGYSLVGEVIQVGNGVDHLKKGDIVACAGAGYANHSEVNFIPKNLCAKVPDGVDLSAIKNSATKIYGVKEIHHVHIWSLSTTENALTAHIVPGEHLTTEERKQMVKQLKEEFLRHNIHHCTIELDR